MARFDWSKAKVAASGEVRQKPDALPRSTVRSGLKALAWITDELRQRELRKPLGRLSGARQRNASKAERSIDRIQQTRALKPPGRP